MFGLLLIGLGLTGAIVSSTLALTAIKWFALLALAAGAGQLIEAVHQTGWTTRLSHALTGLLFIAGAAAMFMLPASATYWMTLVLAAALIVGGAARLIRLPTLSGRGGLRLLTLASGLLSIILGIVIMRWISPPDAEALASIASQREWVAQWGGVLGLFIALELIVQGGLLIADAFSRNMRSDAPATA